MHLSLENRVALVTGGGAGLGRGFAEALARSGAAVAVTGRRKERLDETVAAIEAGGGRALAVAGDVTVDRDVEAVVEETARWGGGRIDILVNNAGIYPPAPLLAMDESTWLEVIDVNLNGAFRYSKRCGAIMAANRWGRIVNIVSPSAVMGFLAISAYAASKAGLDAFTRAAAAELGPLGVTVNALLMGVAATETFVDYYTDAAVEQLAGALPLGRAATAEDGAGVLVLLASDAGAYITGATIPVDGGMTTVMPLPPDLVAQLRGASGA